MTIEVNSPRLLDLVAEDATVEKLGTGFKFTEGPIWNPKEKCVYFSDMPDDKRRRWHAKDGISVVRSPSNKCNGMTLDGARTLYLVRLRQETGLFPATARIEREIAADPSWRAVLPEAETSGWKVLSLRKYVRSAPEQRHALEKISRIPLAPMAAVIR